MAFSKQLHEECTKKKKKGFNVFASVELILWLTGGKAG